MAVPVALVVSDTLHGLYSPHRPASTPGKQLGHVNADVVAPVGTLARLARLGASAHPGATAPAAFAFLTDPSLAGRTLVVVQEYTARDGSRATASTTSTTSTTSSTTRTTTVNGSSTSEPPATVGRDPVGLAFAPRALFVHGKPPTGDALHKLVSLESDEARSEKTVNSGSTDDETPRDSSVPWIVPPTAQLRLLLPAADVPAVLMAVVSVEVHSSDNSKSTDTNTNTNTSGGKPLDVHGIDFVSMFKRNTYIARTGQEFIYSETINDESTAFKFKVEHCEPFVQGMVDEKLTNIKIVLKPSTKGSDLTTAEPKGIEKLIQPSTKFNLTIMPTYLKSQLITPRFLIEPTSDSQDSKTSVLAETTSSLPDFYWESKHASPTLTPSLTSKEASSINHQNYCTNADSVVWCSMTTLDHLGTYSGALATINIKFDGQKPTMIRRVVSLVGIDNISFSKMKLNSKVGQDLICSPTLYYNICRQIESSKKGLSQLDIKGGCKAIEVELIPLVSTKRMTDVPTLEEIAPTLDEMVISRINDPYITTDVHTEALDILTKIFLTDSKSESTKKSKSLFINQGDLVAVIIDKGKVNSYSVLNHGEYKKTDANKENDLDASELSRLRALTKREKIGTSTSQRQVVFFCITKCSSSSLITNTELESTDFNYSNKVEMNFNDKTEFKINSGFFDIRTTRLIVEGIEPVSKLPKFYRSWYLGSPLGDFNLDMSLISGANEKNRIKNLIESAIISQDPSSSSSSSSSKKLKNNVLLLSGNAGSGLDESLTLTYESLGLPCYRFSLYEIWNLMSSSGDPTKGSLTSQLLTFKINDIILQSKFKGLIIIEGFEIFSDKANSEPNCSPDGANHIKSFLREVLSALDTLINATDAQQITQPDARHESTSSASAPPKPKKDIKSILESLQGPQRPRRQRDDRAGQRRTQGSTPEHGNKSSTLTGDHRFTIVCLTTSMENLPQRFATYFPCTVQVPEFLTIEERNAIFRTALRYRHSTMLTNDMATLLAVQRQVSLENGVYNDTTLNDSASQINLGQTLMTVAPDVVAEEIAMHTAGLTYRNMEDILVKTSQNSFDRILELTKKLSLGGSDFNNLLSCGMVIIKKDIMDAIETVRKTASDNIGAPKIPKVYWDDIGGMEHVKSSIIDTIQLPMKHPELFSGNSSKRSGILLYGPPGTGKTLVAKAVATEFGMNFLSVKGPELLNMYIGESEANVRKIFEKAKACKPCIIFFDELDSVAPRRGDKGDSGGVMDRIVSQLLAEIDGINDGGKSTERKPKKKEDGIHGEPTADAAVASKTNEIFIIGATNRPDLLDQALLRPGRFDSLLYLGVSDTQEKQINIMNALCRKFKLDEDVKFEELSIPRNLTGADFYALCSDALLIACNRVVSEVDDMVKTLNGSERPAAHSHPYDVDEVIDIYFADKKKTSSNSHEKIVKGGKEQLVSVAMSDFREALAKLKPSVTAEELHRYEQIRDQIESEKKSKKKNQTSSTNDNGKKSTPVLRFPSDSTANSNPESQHNGELPKGTNALADTEELPQPIDDKGKGKAKAKGKGKGKALLD